MSKTEINFDPERVGQACLDQSAGSVIWRDEKRGIGVLLQADMDEYSIFYLETYADPTAKKKYKDVTVRLTRSAFDDPAWHWEHYSGDAESHPIPDVDGDDAPAAIMFGVRQAVRLMDAE